METQTQPKRNYSFLTRKQAALDSVIDEDGMEYIIPAIPGTTFWAILKYCYERHDQPLNIQDIVEGAAIILEERDPEKWDAFKNKKRVKTLSCGEIIEKEANSWHKRLETNVKTLTRHHGPNAYGKRLVERGHILRQEPIGEKNSCFVLRTDINQPLSKVSETVLSID